MLTPEEKAEIDTLYGFVPDPEPLEGMTAYIEELVRKYSEKAWNEGWNRVVEVLDGTTSSTLNPYHVESRT